MNDHPYPQGHGAPAAGTTTSDGRIAERFSFSAVADVMDPATRTRITARVGDISQTGCYLDVINVFTATTKVILSIQHSGHKLETTGRVAYSLPGMGMGVAFNDLSPEAKAILDQWISGLKSGLAPEPETMETRHAPQEYARVDRQVLGRLIDVMMRKNLLSHDEATGLLNELLKDE